MGYGRAEAALEAAAADVMGVTGAMVGEGVIW